MNRPPKFSESHPDPSGRELIPPAQDAAGLFLVFDGLVEVGKRLAPEVIELPTLPAIKILPYKPDIPSDRQISQPEIV
jgi:hypothetical protein